MIAGIALSSLIGTWACTMNGDRIDRARYTFRADRTGALVSYVPGTRRWRVARHFNFKLTGEGLIEHFTDRGFDVIELHNIRLNGTHLVDESHVYWNEARWTPIPTGSLLDCKR